MAEWEKKLSTQDQQKVAEARAYPAMYIRTIELIGLLDEQEAKIAELTTLRTTLTRQDERRIAAKAWEVGWLARCVAGSVTPEYSASDYVDANHPLPRVERRVLVRRVTGERRNPSPAQSRSWLGRRSENRRNRRDGTQHQGRRWSQPKDRRVLADRRVGPVAGDTP